jgi:hypothetical protein
LALELIIRPEPAVLDTVFNIVAMLCDLLPLVVAIMPMDEVGSD